MIFSRITPIYLTLLIYFVFHVFLFICICVVKMVMATEKKTLTLKEKIDVITYEKHPKLASRAIATNFGVGRTEI